MSTRPARRATPARTSTPNPERQIPIGLKVLARYCFQGGWDQTLLTSWFAQADAVACRILTAPLGNMSGHAVSEYAEPLIDDSGDRKKALAEARKSLSATFSKDAVDEILDEIARTDSATRAGMLLGLCLANRLHVALATGKDGQ